MAGLHFKRSSANYSNTWEATDKNCPWVAEVPLRGVRTGDEDKLNLGSTCESSAPSSNRFYPWRKCHRLDVVFTFPLWADEFIYKKQPTENSTNHPKMLIPRVYTI
jgi:hypothetical protein